VYAISPRPLAGSTRTRAVLRSNTKALPCGTEDARERGGARGARAVLRDPQAVLRDPPAVLRDPQAVLRDPQAVLRDPQAVLHDPQAVLRSRGGCRAAPASVPGPLLRPPRIPPPPYTNPKPLPTPTCTARCATAVNTGCT
jgi:hypothetical protein